jgi:hypothetical protein
MRAAGDAVITGAGLLRIDQQSERAPPVDLVGAGDDSTASALAAQSMRSVEKFQR